MIMKRVLLALITVCLISFGTTVVGGPNSSEGEMAITSGFSSAVSVTEDEAKFKTTVENRENTCSTGNESTGIEFTGFQENGEMTELTFRGSVETSNPCKEIALEVDEVTENSYRVELVERSDSRGICVQCVGNAEFNGSFSAPNEYRVEFVKNDQTLGMNKTPGFTQNPEEGVKEETGQVFNLVVELIESIF